MATTTNMALISWTVGSDPFSHTQLAGNWSKIDVHDHTSGKGVKIPLGGLDIGAVDSTALGPSAVTGSAIATGAVSSTKLAANAVTSAAITSNAVGASAIGAL